MQIPDLRSAIDALSRPFESTNDIKLISMRVDVIAAAMLSNPAIAARLGEQQVMHLTRSDAGLPAILLAIGETSLSESVANLLSFSRSSLVDFGEAEQEVSEANAARRHVHDALASAFGSLDG